MQTEITAGVQQLSKPWTNTPKDRLRRWLFPAAHCELPPAPASFKDVVVTHVHVQLRWHARLLLLLSGRLKVEIKVVTQEAVGGTRSNSVCFVAPPRWMERK